VNRYIDLVLAAATPETPLTALLPAGALAAAGLLAMVRRRRRTIA